MNRAASFYLNPEGEDFPLTKSLGVCAPGDRINTSQLPLRLNADTGSQIIYFIDSDLSI